IASFFLQAEDGIRCFHVTGVQTCALPICIGIIPIPYEITSEGMGIMPMQCCLTRHDFVLEYFECYIGDCGPMTGHCPGNVTQVRSEECRVGKESAMRTSKREKKKKNGT